MTIVDERPKEFLLNVPFLLTNYTNDFGMKNKVRYQKPSIVSYKQIHILMNNNFNISIYTGVLITQSTNLFDYSHSLGLILHLLLLLPPLPLLMKHQASKDQTDN